MFDRLSKQYKATLFFGLSIVIISLGLGIWRMVNLNGLIDVVLGRILEIIPLLGLGFLKLGIGFAIIVIVKNISATGEKATESFAKAGLQPQKTKEPFYTKFFPISIISGILVELVATGVMIGWIITGAKIYNGDASVEMAIANEVLHILAVPIEGIGVALLIGGIAFGLAAIISKLGIQVNLLPKRLKRLIKSPDDLIDEQTEKLVPKGLLASTVVGMIIILLVFLPTAMARAIITPAILRGTATTGMIYYNTFNNAIWEIWMFLGIVTLLFTISYLLIEIIKLLRAQRSNIGKTLSELTGNPVSPIEDELRMQKMIPGFAAGGLVWMISLFLIGLARFIFDYSGESTAIYLEWLAGPSKAIGLAIAFTGIGLALLTIVYNLKLTAFMLPGSFTNFVNIIKGDPVEKPFPAPSTHPLKLTPFKLFIGILVGVEIALLGTFPLILFRIGTHLAGLTATANMYKAFIGPWVSLGIGLIFFMIGMFFSTIVGFVKGRRAIISEGVQTCVYYTLEKKGK